EAPASEPVLAPSFPPSEPPNPRVFYLTGSTKRKARVRVGTPRAPELPGFGEYLSSGFLLCAGVFGPRSAFDGNPGAVSVHTSSRAGNCSGALRAREVRLAHARALRRQRRRAA